MSSTVPSTAFIDSGSGQFFAGFAGYSLPQQPVVPLTAEECGTRRAYCIADFDAHGRVVHLTKILDGQREFTHEYEYDERGVLEQAFAVSSDGMRRQLQVGQRLRASS